MRKQECIPIGCIPPDGWPYPVVSAGRGGVCPGWVSARGGGGCQPSGVCALGGGGCTMWPIPSCLWCYLYVVPAPTETEEQCSCLYNAGHVTWKSMLGYTPHPPLWTEFLTHTCENITFQQLLLRAVITCSCQQFTPKILLNFILQYSFLYQPTID